MDPTNDRPRLLYLVSEDWYFLSHRLPMARAARAAGYDVHVATRVVKGGGAIERARHEVDDAHEGRRGARGEQRFGGALLHRGISIGERALERVFRFGTSETTARDRRLLAHVR